VRDSGMPVILILRNMAHVGEIADPIYVHRLDKRIATVTPDRTR
jgi:hypothetical protein